MKEEDSLGLALKKIAPKGGDIPASLHEEVFSTLDTIRILAEIVDLFTIKFVQTELQALDAGFGNEEKEVK